MHFFLFFLKKPPGNTPVFAWKAQLYTCFCWNSHLVIHTVLLGKVPSYTVHLFLLRKAPRYTPVSADRKHLALHLFLPEETLSYTPVFAGSVSLTELYKVMQNYTF